jgi:hypothetical protein
MILFLLSCSFLAAQANYFRINYEYSENSFNKIEETKSSNTTEIKSNGFFFFENNIELKLAFDINENFRFAISAKYSVLLSNLYERVLINQKIQDKFSGFGGGISFENYLYRNDFFYLNGVLDLQVIRYKSDEEKINIGGTFSTIPREDFYRIQIVLGLLLNFKLYEYLSIQYRLPIYHYISDSSDFERTGIELNRYASKFFPIKDRLLIGFELVF